MTRLVNVRYLTGLDSSRAALLVPAGGDAVLATDGRYAGMAAEVCPELPIIVDRQVAHVLLKRAAEDGHGRVGFEAHDMTVEQHAGLAADAEGELVPLGHLVEELRRVKDEEEIALLREACAITDRAFAAVLSEIRAGVTERAVAVALERAMVDLGAERPAFESIIASGPNGAVPHHHPGGRELERGDLVTLDFGALYGGYHADMTRTVAIGEPADWQRDLYDLVHRAQRAALDAAVPGAETKAVDAAARDVIAAAGHGDAFPTGSGTASAWRSTKRRSWGTTRPVSWWIGFRSPRSRGSTSRAAAACASRTRSWSARAAQSSSPQRPRTCSSCRRAGRDRENNAVATTNDLKNGMTLNLDGQLWTVLEFQHVKPGKGGAFVRTKLKNVLSGKVVDKTFNAGTKVEVASVDKREMQYLYREGEDFVFMDTETYDQPHIPATVVGDAANYLLPEQNAVIAFNNENPLYVELPAAVVLEITETEPGLQGDRSTGGSKPATLETGAQIQVPLFITTGEKVKVDTRSGEYLGRG